MTIDNLQIKNFQSHKLSKFEFVNGLNCIQGTSDSGKSAIIRAIKWLVFNRPGGDGIRRNGKNETEVKLDLITKIKSKKENKYILECGEFKAFGQSVPEEIQQALNLSEINFQFQQDPPFMLSMSPGEVSKYLNKITNLDKIDSSLAHANNRVNRTKQDIATKTTEIQKLDQEIENLNWLDKADEEYEKIEELAQKVDVLINTAEKIELLLEDITVYEKQALTLKSLIDLDEQLQDIESLKDEILCLESNSMDLTSLIDNIQCKILSLKKYQARVQLDSDFSRINNKLNQLSDLKSKQNDLEELIMNISGLNGSINGFKTKIEYLQDTLNKKFPNQCPLCGADQ